MCGLRRFRNIHETSGITTIFKDVVIIETGAIHLTATGAGEPSVVRLN